MKESKKSFLFYVLIVGLPLFVILSIFSSGFIWPFWYRIPESENQDLSQSEIDSKQLFVGPLTSSQTKTLMDMPHIKVGKIDSIFARNCRLDPPPRNICMPSGYLKIYFNSNVFTLSVPPNQVLYTNLFLVNPDGTATHYTTEFVYQNFPGQVLPGSSEITLNGFMGDSSILILYENQKIFLIGNFRDRNQSGVLSNPIDEQRPLVSQIYLATQQCNTKVTAYHNDRPKLNQPLNSLSLECKSPCDVDQQWY